MFKFLRRAAVLACLTLVFLPAASMASASAVKGLPTSFAQCPGFFLGQQPPAVKGGHALRELCFDGFAVLHSGLTRTPVFAAQRLNRKSLGGIPRQRSDRFFADARLRSTERATLDDYRRSGYSRGHLAPSADMATEAAMAQSFSLANMVPQSMRHNSGAWAKVEQDTRKYVQRAKGDVHVVTGGGDCGREAQGLGSGTAVRRPSGPASIQGTASKCQLQQALGAAFARLSTALPTDRGNNR